MDQLIAKLEAATERSRELDDAIFLATHPDQGTCSEDGEYWYAAHLDEDGGPWIILPFYTTSLDAALTLYKTRPDVMPTDPLKACLEALKQ